MFKTKLTLFMATAAVINYSPASAAPIATPNVSVVSTAGLDLSSAAGRAELDHRLVTAAYEVCGTPSDVDLVGKNLAHDCRAEVLAKARAESRQLASGNSPTRIAAAR